MDLKLLNEENFHYLCQGLTLDLHDMQVIDGVLIGLNDKNGLIEKIIMHNETQGAESTLPSDGSGQIIVIFDKYLTSGKLLATATVTQDKEYKGLPPALHINLHSPTLDIPQRIEIPLRYVLKGMMPLIGTYMVYLHVLEINNRETFVYYGITKRGWMKRFNEHVRLAVNSKSDRKFPKLLRESIEARIIELLNDTNTNTRLTGSYHVVCAAGRSKKNASEIERYLITKRSLSEKEGLNMI
ncbi:hypothetical protein HH214_18335 [Mucilaginibacter robiniae]|uniref:GIY-YIG domain-containing protein n=1 Tax=Mucilaginibacter robiniae TaxID=2728022 RepID=A0A7L5E2T8_9SPHI|nr:hypothetical protein [Mucilaginibacter robiniae]QJD97690.1 hypothetical protein HH214_18335 [Mucilaginibacter robiniae]